MIVKPDRLEAALQGRIKSRVGKAIEDRNVEALEGIFDELTKLNALVAKIASKGR